MATNFQNKIFGRKEKKNWQKVVEKHSGEGYGPTPLQGPSHNGVGASNRLYGEKELTIKNE